MKKLFLAPLMALAVSFTAVAPAQAQAAVDTSTPNGLVRGITTDVMTSVKSDPSLQSGDINKIIALVNDKILPYTDFRRTTQLVMGRYWRQATPDQKTQIEEQFKLLLIRTYAGAIAQIRNQTIQYLPYRAAADATDVVVRTQVQNQGNTIELDYRLEKSAAGWKVYDLNVLGAWLIQAYQQQFSEQIQRNGVQGLLQFLTTRNQQLAQKG